MEKTKRKLKYKYMFLLVFSLFFFFLKCIYAYDILGFTFYKTATNETTRVLNIDGVLSSENVDYPAKYYKIVYPIPLKNGDRITLYWRANKNYANTSLFIHDVSGKIYGNVTIPYPQNTFMYSNITLNNINQPVFEIYLSDMSQAGVYEISIDLFRTERFEGNDVLVYTLKNNTIYKYVYRDNLGFVLDAQSEYFPGGVIGLNKDSFDDNFIYFGSVNVSNPNYFAIFKIDVDTLQFVNRSAYTYLGTNFLKVNADPYQHIYFSYYSGSYSYAVKMNKDSMFTTASYSTSSIIQDNVLIDDFYIITRHNNAYIYRLYKENLTIRQSTPFICLSSYPNYLRTDKTYIYTSCYVYYGGSNSTTQYNVNLTPLRSFEGGALNVYPDVNFIYVAKGSYFEKRPFNNLTTILQVSNNYTSPINNIINFNNSYLFFNDNSSINYVDRDYIYNQGAYFIDGQNNLINVKRGLGGYNFLPPTLLYIPANRSIPYNYYVIENPAFYFDNYQTIRVKYINPITKTYTTLNPGEAREYEQFIIDYKNLSFINVTAKNLDYSFYVYFVASNEIGNTETRFIISINNKGYLVTPEEFEGMPSQKGFLDKFTSNIFSILPDSKTLSTKERYTYVLVIFLAVNIILIFGVSGLGKGELFKNTSLSFILALLNFLLFVFFIAIGYIGIITLVLFIFFLIFLLVIKTTGGGG